MGNELDRRPLYNLGHAFRFSASCVPPRLSSRFYLERRCVLIYKCHLPVTLEGCSMVRRLWNAEKSTRRGALDWGFSGMTQALPLLG